MGHKEKNMSCCVIAETEFGSFDGTSRIRKDGNSSVITLFNQYGFPFTTSIKYCPWCGEQLAEIADAPRCRQQNGA